MRMFFVYPIAAALSVMAIGLPGDAAAKRMNSCQLRHSFCTERCIMNRDNDSITKSNACIKRTCDHQFKSCNPDVSSTKDRGGRTGKVVRDKRRRLGDVTRTEPVTRTTPGNVQPQPATTTSNVAKKDGQSVRDHREPPAVRDHRAQPTVRDHRAQPTVRDHRGSSGAKGRDATGKSSGSGTVKSGRS